MTRFVVLRIVCVVSAYIKNYYIKSYHVYLLTNKKHGTLYIGMTSDLSKRIEQHKTEVFEGFSKKYGLKRLVYYESYEDVNEAIRREKQLKNWKRVWKIALIEAENVDWCDLYPSLQ